MQTQWTNRLTRRVMAAAGFTATGAMLAACGASSTAPGGEQEIISRVTITLTPSGGGTPLTAFIEDADGNGPQSPAAQVGVLSLARGVSYTGRVKFENRLVSPPEDITEKVEAEADAHRVYYIVNGAGVTVSPTDTDSQGRPLGVRFTKAVAATGATTGSTRVVLCHYDEVPKTTSSTSCQGETDIDVTFTYTIAP